MKGWSIVAVGVIVLVVIGFIALNNTGSDQTPQSSASTTTDVIAKVPVDTETNTSAQATGSAQPAPIETTAKAKQEPAPTPTTQQKTITTQEELIASQAKVLEALSKSTGGNYSSSMSNAESRYMDLMAPLGVLDPYASENNPVKDDSALINILFGYYGKYFGFSEDRILEIANLPLSYAMQNFDEKDYFAQNESKLETIRAAMNAQPAIKILAYWTSGIGRVNETFNAEAGFWKQDKTSGAYYDLSKVQFAKTGAEADKMVKSSSIANVDPEKTLEIVNQMTAINVTVAYKCGGGMILIMGAASDNASGFIYGDGTPNCGYLGNRFGVIKETKLNDKWRFWVAN